jgi:hypothetical protein
MKKYTFLLLCLFVSMYANAQVPSYVPTNGLVGWWPFNGNANDESGNGNNGIVTGATLTYDRFNNPNSSYHFSGNGTGNQIVVTNPVNLPLGNASRTISVWLKTNSTYWGRNYFVYGGVPSNLWALGIGTNGGGNINYLYPFGIQISNNQWINVVYNYDSITSSRKLFIDGSLVASDIISNINTSYGLLIFGRKHPLSFSYPGDEYIWLGELDDIGIWNRALTPCEIQALYNSGSGSISTINFLSDTTVACGTSTSITPSGNFSSYVWSTGATGSSITVNTSGTYACTVTDANGCLYSDSTYVSLLNAQIQQNDTTICAGTSLSLSLASSGASSNSCAPLPANLQNGLVGYWPFCGNANDESGNGNHGTVNGATLTTDRFGNAGAYLFANTPDNILINNLHQTNISSYSISGWFKIDPAQFGLGGGTVLAGNIPLSTPAGLRFSLGGAHNSQWQVEDGWNTNGILGSDPNGSYNNNQWHHFVSTFSSGIGLIDSSAFKIYIDGQLIPSISFQQNWPPGSGFSMGFNVYAPVNNGSLPVVIGNHNGFMDNFKGALDEISIYNRALSATEVAQMYAIGNPDVITYLWSTGDTTASINVTPSQTTTYYCTVSNGISSCTDSVTVTVNSAPTNFFAQDTIAACGISSALSAPANYTYSWSTGDTTQNINVTSSGWYSCTLSNAVGCTSTDSVYVSLLNAQIPQNDTTVCIGSLVQLSVASSAISNGANLFSLQWSNNYLNTNGIFRKAILDNDSLVISGSIWSSWPSGTTDQLVTKISSAGNLAFQQVRAPGGDHDGYASVQKMNNGNYIFFGQENAQGTQYFDGFWTIFNRSGIEINYGFFSVPGSSSGSDMLKLPNGNYVFTGPQGNDGYIALTDSNLSQINYQNFTVGNWTGPMLAIDSVNNFIYVLTSTANFIKVCKYDFNLNQILSNTLTFAGNVGIDDMQFFSGKLYVVGYLESSGLRHSLFGNIDAMCNLSYSQVASDESEYNAIVSVPSGFVIACSKLSGTQSYASRLYYVNNSGLKLDSFTVNNSPFVSSDLVYSNGKLFNVGVSGTGYGVGMPRVDMLLFQPSNTSYLWSTGDTTASINVTPTQTTTYYCAVSNGISSCTDSVTVTVSQPTIVASATSTNVCAGASSTLSATGAATCTWMPGNLTGSPVVTPTSTTIYTVTGTNASGCTNTSTVTLTVNPLPTIVANASAASICAGSSSTLSATGGTTYVWMPGNLTGSPIVTPTATTTYTVTGTNASGCSNTATKMITVNPLPNVVASASSTSICAGASTTLSATGAATYTWMPGNLTGSPTVTPTTTTTYTVTGTNASGCSNTATKTITVNPLPNVVANASSTSLCTGASTTLSATGAATYTWMPVNLTGSPTVTPTTTTTYTVTGANASGCTNTATIMISVNATLPVVASASSNSLCMGASSTLSATGAATYTWMPGNLTGSPVVSPISTTTYTVTGTSASGCSNTSTVTIVVNPLPTMLASASPSTICAGASSTLSATGATTYTWMPGSLTGSPVVTPTSTTTYTVTGTSASGCTNTATKTITVNPLPNVVANASSLNICAGSSATLSATGAATYSWMPGSLTGSPTVTPTATTTYTVTGTNASGCSNTSTVTIVVNSLPTVTASTSVASICVGSSSTLSATGASSYTWMPGNLTGSPMVTPTTSTTYTVTGTNASGCSNTATVTIVVYPIVLATITPAGSTTFCQGDSVVLQGNTGAGLSYQWYNGTTLIAGASNANYTASSNGNYVLQVSSSTCSVYSSTQSVVVHANPVITISPVGATTFCQGGSVLLQANAGAGFNYQWYNGTSPITGANAANYTTGVSGTYAVLVSDANACTALSPALPVVVNPLPIAAISASGPTTFCSGNNVILSTPANTGYAYQWSNGLTIAGATNSSYTVTQGGNYQVLVSDATGCTASNGPIAVVVNPSPFANIVVPGPTSFCQGGSVMLNANTGSGLSYQWYNGATLLGVTSSIYTAIQSGSYQVVVSNAIGCSSTSTPTVVTVFPTPTPVITGAGNLLSVTGGPFTTYQWYLNGVAIIGAINATYVFTQNGNYTVKVSKDGCVGESVVYTVKNVGVDDLENQLVVISPNPASGMVQIEGYKPHEIRLFNSQGQLVMQLHEAKQFSVSHLASGIYYVQLYNKEGALLYRQKLIRE